MTQSCKIKSMQYKKLQNRTTVTLEMSNDISSVLIIKSQKHG